MLESALRLVGERSEGVGKERNRGGRRSRRRRRVRKRERIKEEREVREVSGERMGPSSVSRSDDGTGSSMAGRLGVAAVKWTGVTEVGQTTPFSGQAARRLVVFESATRARSLGERDGSARRPYAPHSQSDGYVELKPHPHIHPSSPSPKGRSDDLKQR